MATIEQMAALSTPFVTSQGVEYRLPPLNLLTRRKAAEYVALAREVQKSDAPSDEQADRLFDGLVDLLIFWLGRCTEGLTRERIEEDWDIADVPRLMRIINGMEEEIASAVPPASSAPKKATRSRKT